MLYVNFISSLFTGILCIYVIIQLFTNRHFPNKINQTVKNYWSKFVLLLIFLISIRAYHFGTHPIWYNMDEAMSTYDAYSLLLYGTDHWGNSYPTHMLAWGYTNQSALFTYILVPFIKIFGYNLLASRLPLLILSVLGAVFLSLIARDIFGDRVSLIALFICSVNPWHFVQSRYGIDCNVFPHLFIAGIFFFIHFIKTKKYQFLYIGTLTMALSLYSYMIAVYSVPLFMLMLFIYLITKSNINLRTFILNVLLFVSIASPMIVFVFANLLKIPNNITVGKITIPSLSLSDRTGDILFMSPDIVSQLFNNAISLFKNIFLQVDSWPWDTVEHYGTMYHAMASVIFVGIILLILSFLKKNNESYDFVLLSYLVMAIWIGLITADVTVIRRLNVFYYLGMLLICFFIEFLYKTKELLAKSLVIMFIPLGVLLVFSYHHSYLADLSGPESVTANFPQALAKAKELDASKYYITSNCLGPDSGPIAEIYTLVSYQIDPKFYLTADYHDKYNYVTMESLSIDGTEDAVYVVTIGEKKLFDEYLYDCYDYSLYSVMVPCNLK